MDAERLGNNSATAEEEKSQKNRKFVDLFHHDLHCDEFCDFLRMTLSFSHHNRHNKKYDDDDYLLLFKCLATTMPITRQLAALSVNFTENCDEILARQNVTMHIYWFANFVSRPAVDGSSPR
jgi:hypothetical protein